MKETRQAPLLPRGGVCFVAPFAYSLFIPSSNAKFGGAEVRASYWAHGLAEAVKGRIGVMVMNHGQPQRMGVGPIEFHSFLPEDTESRSLAARRHGLLRWWWQKRAKRAPAEVREFFLEPNRLTAYMAARAGLYVGFGVNDWTAELAAFCRTVGRPLVLSVASDEDLSDSYRPGNTSLNSYFSRADRCHFALTQASRLIVQTPRQQEMARSRFGIEATVIANPCPADTAPIVEASSPPRVVWIGRADRVKQPQLFARLATAVPDATFEMVMNPSLAEIAEAVRSGAPPNLTIIDALPRASIRDFMRGATALVNTSVFEGFPNTFLEAWSLGIPVVSLGADPNGALEQHGCGLCASGDPDALIAGLGRLLADRPFRDACGRRARDYVETHHGMAPAIAGLIEVIAATRC